MAGDGRGRGLGGGDDVDGVVAGLTGLELASENVEVGVDGGGAEGGALKDGIAGESGPGPGDGHCG